MLRINTTPAERRLRFRRDLASGRTLRYAGAFSPLVSRMLEELGFDGLTVAGATIAADLGLPDIGLFTLTELAQRGGQIANGCNLPCLVDCDTGFGEPQSAFRTTREMEAAGMASLFIEDQIAVKRCGHLDNKTLVDVPTMATRLRAACDGRLDSNFAIMARTDARAVEGLDAAIERARAYIDAGADMIFPDALHDEREFERFRAAIDVPLVANMTAFGQTKLLSYESLSNLGINIVCYPNTAFRLALQAVETHMRELLVAGTQAGFLDALQPRARLYELLDYDQYNRFGDDIFNFAVPDGETPTVGQADSGSLKHVS